MNLIQKAIKIATSVHENQWRKGKSGGFRLPYIFHPFDVAKMVWRFGFGDEINIAASILHDIEDSSDYLATLDLVKALGEPELVEVVADLSFLSGTKEEYMKRFSNPSMNIRSVILKACDRLSNVKDLVANGESDYAKKYLKKADSVYNALLSREEEIIKKWDVYAYYRLMNNWTYK